MRWRWHPPFPVRGPGEDLDWHGLQPVPRSTPGAMPGVPRPRFSCGFTRMLNLRLECRGIKQGNEPLQAGSRIDQRRQWRPMPCCSSPLPSPVQKGRSSPGRRSATPLLASDRLCIDDARALLVGKFPHDSPPAPRVLFTALFHLFCRHLLPSLCSKQSREARPYDFRCNAFCLKESRWNKSLCF